MRAPNSTALSLAQHSSPRAPRAGGRAPERMQGADLVNDPHVDFIADRLGPETEGRRGVERGGGGRGAREGGKGKRVDDGD